jgi:tetratricopeptide (TPR) repeat protein
MKRTFVSVIFSTILLASPLVPLAASETLSPAGQTAVDDFMTLRMNLAKYLEPKEALAAIDTYSSSHFTGSSYNAFTGEEKLILENFVVLEKYNYMRKIDGQEVSIKKMLAAQHDKVTSWMAAEKDSVINKWMYCTAADLISCNLSYASVSTIIHEGLAVKTYYEKALEQDPKLSYALTNIAQWYYYAPSFGGGSKSKAKKCFEQAIAGARTQAETYYAKIFLSQYLFEDESRRGEAATLLAEAATFCPGGHYTEWLARINKAGFSLYYYYAHKLGPADVDKAIGMI